MTAMFIYFSERLGSGGISQRIHGVYEQAPHFGNSPAVAFPVPTPVSRLLVPDYLLDALKGHMAKCSLEPNG